MRNVGKMKMRASLVNLAWNAACESVEYTAPGIGAPLMEDLEELDVAA